MKKQCAYKFNLRPTTKSASRMSRAAGCCRFVWNKALAIQQERLEKKSKILNYYELASLLVRWKKEFFFLREAHSQSLQQTLMNLDRALKDSLSKKSPKKFPRFKKKNLRDSFSYPQGHKLEQNNARIYLPKVGWVRYRKSINVEGLPKNITISRRRGKWYGSIQVEVQVPEPCHKSNSIVGIDLGIAKFAMCSDGAEILPLNSFKTLEHRLAFLQRGLARKTKFSRNWFKQKKKISQCHAKISDCRKDFLHKTTDTISKNHAIVVIEDLKVRSMSKSARGSLESPGKNVRCKSGLNRSILDQGWFEFRRQLEYKLSWKGGKLVVINPEYTSQQCSICGCLDKANRETQSLFLCKSCGYRDNADFNAAKNIRAAGLAVIACGGDDVSHPGKQEPSVLSSMALASIQSESSCFS